MTAKDTSVEAEKVQCLLYRNMTVAQKARRVFSAYRMGKMLSIAGIRMDHPEASEEQVWQLARAVDDLKVPIMCYGLRVDFQGKLFPGSATLLALADEMREVRTICHCGKKATMVARMGPDGQALREGAQVQIGGNETYVSLCRKHWREAIGDARPTAPEAANPA